MVSIITKQILSLFSYLSNEKASFNLSLSAKVTKVC